MQQREPDLFDMPLGEFLGACLYFGSIFAVTYLIVAWLLGISLS